MFIWLISIPISIYIFILVLMYHFQEKLIFVPDKLPKDHHYLFDIPFEERSIETNDHIKLNALLFKANNAKGLVFFIHGNAGSLNSWGYVSHVYVNQGYDVFIYDFRGFGKSEGQNFSETQFFDDAQQVYNSIKNAYNEDKIILIGQSLGTAAATKLAAQNHPKKLILLTPYFSLINLMKEKYYLIPEFLLKYPFRTYKYIQQVKAPVALIHGTADELINPKASTKLKKLCKVNDELIIIKNMNHNGIHDNKEFQKKIGELLK